MKKHSLKFKIIFHFAFSFCILTLVFCVFSSAHAQTASAYITPYSGTFSVGSTFGVSVFVNTDNNNINAVEIDLKFPPNLLQVTSPTAGSSFISVWANQPSYSNKNGTISFQGGVPAPGINTSAGLVSTVTFMVMAPGSAKISFASSSKILLANGKATNILQNAAGAEYTLTLPPPEGPQISSPTHPDQNTWYKNNNPVFDIEKDSGVTAFSYDIDQDPNGIPDNSANTTSTFVTIDNVGNGIWYFHVKALKDGVWGGVSTYPVKIDDIPPEPFNVNIESIHQSGNTGFFANFSANDTLSGIDHYEVSVVNTADPQAAENPFYIVASSPYQIPVQSAGKYVVFVRAFDRAGNFTQSQATFQSFGTLFAFTSGGIQIENFLLPPFAIYILIVAIIIALGFLLYKMLRKRNLTRQLKVEVAEAEKEIDDVRKFEKNLENMHALEEEAKRQSERLAEKLTENENRNDQPKI